MISCGPAFYGGTAGAPTGSGWNPADWASPIGGATSPVLTNSNRTLRGGNSETTIRGTQSRSSGKLYFEVIVDAIGSAAASSMNIGLCDAATTLPPASGFIWVLVNNGLGNMSSYHAGFFYDQGPIMANGTVCMVAVDFGADQVFMGQGGGFYHGGVALWGDTSGKTLFPYAEIAAFSTGAQVTLRTLASQFTYAPPTGFSEWG